MTAAALGAAAPDTRQPEEEDRDELEDGGDDEPDGATATGGVDAQAPWGEGEHRRSDAIS